MDYIFRLKALLPIDTSQFLCCFLDLLSTFVHDAGTTTERNFVVQGGDSVKYILSKVDRELTISFHFPLNGRYYIAVTSYAFLPYVSGWVGSVSDCFHFQSPSPDHPLQPFTGGYPIAFI